MRSRFLAICVAALVAWPSSALAYEWKRPLEPGDRGKDVKALQIRIAGWFPERNKKTFHIDGAFGSQTTRALKRFQRHYRMTADGIAGRATYKRIERLTDKDGSTKHFDWAEFWQKRNPSCSAKANAYAGTFQGGMVARSRVKRNIKRMMWRLEAVRAKGGAHPVGINSAFRSVPYNDCIGGARASQHLYGTAVDSRMAETTNRKHRSLSKRSQLSGIACYRRTTHNHLDLRVENRHDDQPAYWWWPERDGKGRDLDYAGKPCWGEMRRTRAARTAASPYTTPAILQALMLGHWDAGSLVPSAEEIEAFSRYGEPTDLFGID